MSSEDTESTAFFVRLQQERQNAAAGMKSRVQTRSGD
jgi:hypothetical protein